MAGKKKATLGVVHVPTKTGRFLIENQTKYNTDDILAILNAIEEDAQARRETQSKMWYGSSTEEERQEYISNWWRNRARVPFGAVIQLTDKMNGVSKVTNRDYNHTTREFETVQRQIYVEAGDFWNIVRICPPDKLYANPLEALSADDTNPTAPQVLVNQLVSVFSESLYEAGGINLPKPIRIEESRGSARRGANKRPAELGKFYQEVYSTASSVSSSASNLQYAIHSIARREESAKKLNVATLEEVKQAVTAAQKAVEEASNLFRKYVENIPQE